MIEALTVLIPTFDEARRIGPSLERVLGFLAGRFTEYQVVVADDGSRDGTADLVTERFGARVDVVRGERNRGKGAALRRGVEAARHPWVLLVDADLGIPIEELEVFLPHAERAPVLIGSKRIAGAANEQPPWRRLGGGLGQLLIRWCAVSGFHDTQCGFKLLRADVAREVFRAGRLEGFGYDFELLYLCRRLGHQVLEFPVRARHAGDGTISLASYLGVLGDLARFNLNRLSGRYPRARG